MIKLSRLQGTCKLAKIFTISDVVSNLPYLSKYSFQLGDKEICNSLKVAITMFYLSLNANFPPSVLEGFNE